MLYQGSLTLARQTMNLSALSVEPINHSDVISGGRFGSVEGG